MGMFNTPTKQVPQGKNGGGVSDNIDAVDMEMSDEEQDGVGGETYKNFFFLNYEFLINIFCKFQVLQWTTTTAPEEWVVHHL